MKLEENVDIIPHYITFPIFDVPQEKPVDNCYYNGVYCADPDYRLTSDGRVILQENLRQKCIYFNSYDKNDKNKITNKMQYWDYMDNFYEDCFKPSLLDNSSTGSKFNSECSRRVMSKTGIDIPTINSCIVKSFNTSIIIFIII